MKRVFTIAYGLTRTKTTTEDECDRQGGSEGGSHIRLPRSGFPPGRREQYPIPPCFFSEPLIYRSSAGGPHPARRVIPPDGLLVLALFFSFRFRHCA
jgi:hypothetical protein